jgi:hypothetical protein
VYQLEGAAASQAIAAAQAKRNAARAIDAMHGFLAEADAQRRLLSRVLAQPPIADGPRSIPVAFFEADGLTVAATQRSIHFSEAKCVAALREKVSQSAAGVLPELGWRAVDATMGARIQGDFDNLLGKSDASARVKTEMQRLFKASGWMTIGRPA